MKNKIKFLRQVAVVKHLMWTAYDLACVQNLKEGTKSYRRANAIVTLYQRTQKAIGYSLGISGHVYVNRHKQYIEIYAEEGDYIFDFKGNLIEFIEDLED